MASSSSKNLPFNIEQFNGQGNFILWQERVKNILTREGTVKALRKKDEKPEKLTDDEWQDKRDFANCTIKLCLADNTLQEVLGLSDPAEVWEKLESRYKSKSLTTRLHVKKQFYGLRLSEGGSFEKHLDEFNRILTQMSALDEKIKEEDKALVLLASLPASYDHIVTTLLFGKDTLMLDEVIASLLMNESRRSQGTPSSSHSEVLVTESRGRSKGRYQKPGEKSRSKSRSRYQNLECHHCGKKGHIKKHCFKWKRENAEKEKSDKGRGEEMSSVSIVTSVDLLLTCQGEVANLTDLEFGWVIDSGATLHVTSRRELYTSYTPGDFGVIRMGNKGISPVVGRGDIVLTTNNGTKLLLKDVHHVPDIRLNVISAGRLDDEGYCNTFCEGEWKLTRGSFVAARGKKCSGLYVMEVRAMAGDVNATVCKETDDLWHRRLGHMSEKGLSHLVGKGLIKGTKEDGMNMCPHCLAGKQRRVSFNGVPSNPKTGLLDLIHTDVCGPFKEKSIGGAQYFVSFIDDCSRKLWVYPLKTKDQVLGVFEQFHALVERQTGKKLKSVRSDNGGEYLGPFDAYCRKHGIRHQKTPPKTPQLNGVAERMNRTLLEKVRCMLSESKLNASFWAEALQTAAYIINRSPSKPLMGEVAEKIWTGKEPSYDHLRVFGCKAFVHVPRDERTKLEPKTMQCVFLGYGEDELGYRFYDPVTRKLVRSRDVTFAENETIEDIGRKANCNDKLIDKVSSEDVHPVLETGSDGQHTVDWSGGYETVEETGEDMVPDDDQIEVIPQPTEEVAPR